MRLTSRIKYVLSFCEKSAHTVDVGTDHGFLAVALIDHGIAERVTATDLNKGPLSNAEKLIKWFALDDKIDTKLTDGLKGVKGEDIDQVVIAGMGGELIARIIDDSPLVKNERVHLVLQPMTKIPDLRRYLAASGFRTLRQGAVFDESHIYETVTARYDGIKRVITPLEAEVGSNTEGSWSALYELYDKKIAALEKRLIGAEKNDPEEAALINELISQIKIRREEV